MECSPLTGVSYIYTGENTEAFKKGNYYKVIQAGQHWYKEWGYGVWMTTKEDPDTDDIDYGCFVNVAQFKKKFWR